MYQLGSPQVAVVFGRVKHLQRLSLKSLQPRVAIEIEGTPRWYVLIATVWLGLEGLAPMWLRYSFYLKLIHTKRMSLLSLTTGYLEHIRTVLFLCVGGKYATFC